VLRKCPRFNGSIVECKDTGRLTLPAPKFPNQFYNFPQFCSISLLKSNSTGEASQCINLNPPSILGRIIIRPYPCGIAEKIEKSDGGFRLSAG
jgi:hypothetical protein